MSGLLAKYERIHAYFMADPRFWYEKGRQEADKMFCLLASDMRRGEDAEPDRSRDAQTDVLSA